MIYKKNIFDVGAFNGLDGLIMAIINPKIMVHAFEANPELIKVIKNNKKKIENYKKIKIRNYKINNFAVSNKDKVLEFNIAKNPTVSSLNKFSKNIDKTWPGYKEEHCTFKKKIKIKGITLNKYCNENNIKKINYIHIDTQGNDLKVLLGLKNKIKIVEKGVMEAAIDKKKSLYQNNHTISEAQKFLKKNNFHITKIEFLDETIRNEKNIFFEKKAANLSKIKNKYNLRYYNRIINDKLNFKDKFIDKIKHIL